MDFVLQTPSLQHLTLVKIVAALWNQRDIFTQIAQTFNVQLYNDIIEVSNEWQEMEEKIRNKVWVLPLPGTCKKELLNFIKPIGMEIITWYRYHCLDGYTCKILETLLPRQVCWSMRGTIDYAKTAEVMVNDRTIAVERRYQLACLNCLEDKARHLFQLIPEWRRQKFLYEEREYYSTDNRILVAYFTCTFSGAADHLNRLYQALPLRGGLINRRLFAIVLCKGTRAACQHWFNKLSPPEKDDVLDESQLRWYAIRYSRASSLMYYLSLMNEEQQRRMFENYTCEILNVLLGWPMQPLFVGVAERGWGHVGYDSVEVLKKIISKIGRGFQDYEYSQLFWECWRLSSAEDKKHYLQHCELLSELLIAKREDFFRLILNEAPWRQLLTFSNRLYKILIDSPIMSDAALMECKERASSISASAPRDEEKRLRSKHVSRIVDRVMEKRVA